VIDPGHDRRSLPVVSAQIDPLERRAPSSFDRQLLQRAVVTSIVNSYDFKRLRQSFQDIHQPPDQHGNIAFLIEDWDDDGNLNFRSRVMLRRRLDQTIHNWGFLLIQRIVANCTRPVKFRAQGA